MADAMKEELIKKVETLKGKGITPKLGIIRVGQRPDDLFYEGGAKKTSASIGMGPPPAMSTTFAGRSSLRITPSRQNVIAWRMALNGLASGRAFSMIRSGSSADAGDLSCRP